MSVINNSHAIGVDTRNLVLKTRGSIHVKVGDSYYELNFKDNTSPTENSKDDIENTKSEYILTISNSSEIDTMNYPGDNKLIVSLDDKKIFVTVDGVFIDISSNSSNEEPEDVIEPLPETENVEQEITELGDVLVRGTLSGYGDTSVDFSNSSITTSSLSVLSSFSYPKNTVTTHCARTTTDRSDYRAYNFIGMEKEVDELRIKPGTIVRSEVKKTVTVRINEYSRDFDFSKEKTYIFFIWDGTITYNYL